MQSRVQSLYESFANIGVGMAIAFVSLAVLFPALGVASSAATNVALVGAMTVLSVLRSYGLRRVFNAISTTQSPLDSAVEQGVSLVVAYFVNLLAQIILYPVLGLQAGISEGAAVAAWFSGITLLRGYVIRRQFERQAVLRAGAETGNAI